MDSSHNSYSLQKKPIGFSCTTSLQNKDSLLACCHDCMIAGLQQQKTKTISVGGLLRPPRRGNFMAAKNGNPYPFFRPPLKLRLPAMPRLLGGLTAAIFLGVGWSWEGWGWVGVSRKNHAAEDAAARFWQQFEGFVEPHRSNLFALWPGIVYSFKRLRNS